jgi:hypothetical protein
MVNLCGGRASGDDWTLASAVDRDFASGLESSLVISVVDKPTFSLRGLRLQRDT